MAQFPKLRPVVALHGNLGCPSDWDPVERGLGMEMKKWDLFGEPPVSFQTMARRLCDDALTITPRPVLLGYSLGGRLALHALLESPDAWAAAVIVSAHTGLADAEDRELRREKDRNWAELSARGEWLDFLEKWDAQAVFSGAESRGSPPVGIPSERRQNISKGFTEWSLGKQSDLLIPLAKLDVPVLWVCGEQDVKYTGIARAATDRMRAATLVTIAGVGHRVAAEAPRALADAILRFPGAVTDVT